MHNKKHNNFFNLCNKKMMNEYWHEVLEFQTTRENESDA
jgi:hypothetical protein